MPAALHQSPERLAEVALGHHVVGERVENLVGVEGWDRLGAVPTRVPGGASEQPVACGGYGGRRLQIAGIRGESGRHRVAGNGPTVAPHHRPSPVIGGRRCRPSRSGPC